jgi:T-complex protein 1 subunit zeta
LERFIFFFVFSFLTVLRVLQQIQHPTAALIARAATAQDDISGDGYLALAFFFFGFVFFFFLPLSSSCSLASPLSSADICSFSFFRLNSTTTTVILIAELLRQSERFLQEGLHPRVIADGFELAKNKVLEILDNARIKKNVDRELLLCVARTSLRTKVHQELADSLTEIVTDAVLSIRK